MSGLSTKEIRCLETEHCPLGPLEPSLLRGDSSSGVRPGARFRGPHGKSRRRERCSAQNRKGMWDGMPLSLPSV